MFCILKMAYRLVREPRYYENPFPIPELPPPDEDDDVSDTEPLYDEWEDQDQEQLEQLEQLEELEDNDNNEQEDCPICLTPYNTSNRKKYTITKCQLEHPLCRSCAVEIVNLARRLHKTPQCPMCRKEFNGTENVQNKTFSFNGLYKKSKRTSPHINTLLRKRSPRKSHKKVKTLSRKSKSLSPRKSPKKIKTLSRKSRTRSFRKSRK